MSALHTIVNQKGETTFYNTNTACFYQVFAESRGYKKLSPGDTFRIFVPDSWLRYVTPKRFKLFLKLLNRWGFKNSYQYHESLQLEKNYWVSKYPINGTRVYTVDLKVDDYKDLQYLKIAGYLIRYTWESSILINSFFDNLKKIKQSLSDYDSWQIFVLCHAHISTGGHGMHFKVMECISYTRYSLKEVLKLKQHRELFDKEGFSWGDCIHRFTQLMGPQKHVFDKSKISLEDICAAFQNKQAAPIEVSPPPQPKQEIKVEAPKIPDKPLQKESVVLKEVVKETKKIYKPKRLNRVNEGLAEINKPKKKKLKKRKAFVYDFDKVNF